MGADSGPEDAGEWLDNIDYCTDAAQRKKLVFGLPARLKDVKWAEDFVEQDGLTTLTRLMQSVKQSVTRGYILAGLRALMMHTFACQVSICPVSLHGARGCASSALSSRPALRTPSQLGHSNHAAGRLSASVLGPLPPALVPRRNVYRRMHWKVKPSSSSPGQSPACTALMALATHATRSCPPGRFPGTPSSQGRVPRQPRRLAQVFAVLLAPTKERSASSAAMLLNALEVFIVLAGLTDEGHRMLHHAAKTVCAKKTTEPPYTNFVYLLGMKEVNVVEKTLLLINCMMMKRKKISDLKAKKFFFHLQNAGVIKFIDSIEKKHSGTKIGQTIGHFKKNSTFKIPESWYEANKWKTQHRDISKKCNESAQQIFLLQQQKPKVKLLTDQIIRCHDTLLAISIQYGYSPNHHPLHRHDAKPEAPKKKKEANYIDTHDKDPDIRDLRVAVFERYSRCLDFKEKLELAIKKRLDTEDDDQTDEGSGMSDDENSDDDDDVPLPSGSEDDIPDPSGSEPPSDDDDDVVVMTLEEIGAQEAERKAMEEQMAALEEEKKKIAAEKDSLAASERRKIEEAEKAAAEEQKKIDDLMRQLEEAKAREQQMKEQLANPSAAAPVPPPPGGAKGPAKLPPPPPGGAKGPAKLPPPPPGKLGKLPPPPPGKKGLPPPPPGKGKLPPPPLGKLGKLPLPGKAGGAAAEGPRYFHGIAVMPHAMNCDAGAAPKAKMRPLHWEKCAAKEGDGTLWWDVQKILPKDCEYDWADFEMHFQQADKKEKVEKKEEKKGPIMLIAGIMELDGETLQVDNLESVCQLIEAIDKNTKTITLFTEEHKSGKKPFEDYDTAEMFLIMLGEVPEIRRRLNTWKFTREFEENHRQLMKPVGKLEAAVKANRECSGLKHVLGVILNCGNFMNYTSKMKGNFPGFAPKTLAKIEMTKGGTDRAKVSLLQYVVKTVANNQNEGLIQTEVLHLYDDLKCCLECHDMELKGNIEEPLKQFKESLDKFRTNMKNVSDRLVKDGTDKTDPFIEKMGSFKTKAEAVVEAAFKRVEKLKEDFLNLMKWWGVPAGQLKDAHPSIAIQPRPCALRLDLACCLSLTFFSAEDLFEHFALFIKSFEEEVKEYEKATKTKRKRRDPNDVKKVADMDKAKKDMPVAQDGKDDTMSQMVAFI
eukprot:gene5335-952_t